MIDGPLLSLDLGISLGWAFGPVAGKPESGATLLKQKGEPASVAMGNLIAFLDERCRAEKPALIVKEAPFPLEAYRKQKNSEQRVKVDYGFHAIVDGMADRFGIKVEAVYAATVRKFFLGRANMGERSKTKQAVVQRCHLLGLMPKHSMSDDRADSLATWYWAASVYGHRMADKLFLFGEGNSKHDGGSQG